MPKDVKRVATASSVDGRYHIKLRDIAPYDLYKRLKADRKASRKHELTTDELTKLLDAAAQFKYSDSDEFTEAANAAEAAKQRQNKIIEQRASLLERLNKAQAETPTPIIAKNPINDKIKKIDLDDRRRILASKLSATIKRLQALQEVGNAGESVRSGLERLQLLEKQFDEVVKDFEDTEWRSINWGLTSIGGVSFKRLRYNFDSIVRTVGDICDQYFCFLEI